jgi:hypothetical protein
MLAARKGIGASSGMVSPVEEREEPQNEAFLIISHKLAVGSGNIREASD